MTDQEPVEENAVEVPRPWENRAYKESDEHVPNPYFQYAQVDTTGTGAQASTIEEISPAFTEARADALGVSMAELTNQTDDAAGHTVLTNDDPNDVLNQDNGGDQPFDPSEANVDEVNEHLAAADSDERARVLQAEADGKNRTTIVNGPHAGE